MRSEDILVKPRYPLFESRLAVQSLQDALHLGYFCAHRRGWRLGARRPEPGRDDEAHAHCWDRPHEVLQVWRPGAGLRRWPVPVYLFPRRYARCCRCQGDVFLYGNAIRMYLQPTRCRQEGI